MERGSAGGAGRVSIRAFTVADVYRQNHANTRAGRNERSPRHAVRVAFQRVAQEPQGEKKDTK